MAGAPPIKNLPKAHALHDKQVSGEPYDYIIVGGGLAGCVLAERLSQSGDKRILVLEAGRPDYNNLQIRIPAGILRLFRSQYDWQYESAREAHCEGRNLYLQRGKVLGGSSCTNACLYHRGSAQDYNDWKVPGWTANDVLPFFKLSQKDTTGMMSTEYHGTKGKWTMSHVRYQNPLSKRFLQVGKAAGLGVNDDFNNWSRPQTGVGRFAVSETNGERCSGATAFLSKAMKRKNVVVQSGCMVRHIDFDSAKNAIGVTYNLMGDDTFKNFCANLKPGGEVIVTAGAIASPQLLMCSGIGPRKHLTSHGIHVIHDNPNVGCNLQDHPAAVVSFQTSKRGISVTSKLRLFGKTNPLPLLKWLLFKRGLLTSTGCDHGGFVRTNAATGTQPQPDLQLRFLAAKALGPDGMTTFTQFRNTKNHEDGYSIQCIACRARSQGTVRLASSNTMVKPIIQVGYFSNPQDLATLREGIKLGRQLCNHPEWGDDYRGTEVYPGPQVRTNEEIEAYIRRTVHTSNALTGTCKMGLGNDSVVDPQLRVRGVQGVRVADSSILPVIPGGQTATPTVMVAERAAHSILEEATSTTLDDSTKEEASSIASEEASTEEPVMAATS
ncbi:Alcohol dehydrogenase [acceptor] [Seminavis robusta]|uniref:Alcohol dehydrogenase [acceptor] n=1 Tax=Seminavis robusta TaxID=568900 RepID=A0A9N8HBI4_9STRA|nr:Alcohol dehydrogenase [acceptor] [Seminavis robusta]|eukprot:Sro184_g079900.1 Alcohol dehydrogenase [acceptor] (608) ;mRNA; r:35175-37291